MCNKAMSCTSILAFKQIKVYNSVMHVGKKFQPVNVVLVGKIYVEYNFGWKTGFILELLLSICPKTVNEKHWKGMIFYFLFFVV